MRALWAAAGAAGAMSSAAASAASSEPHPSGRRSRDKSAAERSGERPVRWKREVMEPEELEAAEENAAMEAAAAAAATVAEVGLSSVVRKGPKTSSGKLQAENNRSSGRLLQ